jgi:hypothetical protein
MRQAAVEGLFDKIGNASFTNTFVIFAVLEHSAKRCGNAGLIEFENP